MQIGLLIAPFPTYCFLMNIYPNIGKLILASASPRRRELLGLLGIPFSVVSPEIEEIPFPDEPPREFAERMAREKASVIKAEADSTLIAADTIVVQGSTILGKPIDAAHAFEMLSGLSGLTHQVITAVCVRHHDVYCVFSVVTAVEFRVLDPDEIKFYIATGEPMDKAGAYAIQGGAAHMVRSISGSYTNVVGFPLCELHGILRSF